MRRGVKAIGFVVGIPLLLVLVHGLLCSVFPVVLTPLMLIRATQGEGLEQEWVPLEQISPHMARAVIAAEDNRFCTHSGIDFEAVRTAVGEYRDGGRLRGASTISMQTVKNLYLWPGRSWIRKGLELVLVAELAAAVVPALVLVPVLVLVLVLVPAEAQVLVAEAQVVQVRVRVAVQALVLEALVLVLDPAEALVQVQVVVLAQVLVPELALALVLELVLALVPVLVPVLVDDRSVALALAELDPAQAEQVEQELATVPAQAELRELQVGELVAELVEPAADRVLVDRDPADSSDRDLPLVVLVLAALVRLL